MRRTFNHQTILRFLVCNLFVLSLFILGATAYVYGAQLVVHGSAMVNKGYGYKRAPVSMPVAPGDRVRVVKGCVQILYSNGFIGKGCAGNTMLVLTNPPCPPDAACTGPASEAEEALLLYGFAVGTSMEVFEMSSHRSPASP